jgi:hypothetical protein
MVALATCGSRLRNPWLLPRCSTGTGWANPGRRGVPADHRATRSDGCAVLIAGFTFEQWPGVRHAGLRRLRSGASQKQSGAVIWPGGRPYRRLAAHAHRSGAVPPGGALSARQCRPDLWLDLDPVRCFGLAFSRRLGLGAGLAFKAGRVVRAGLPRGVAGGDAVYGLVRAGLQGVQAGRPIAGLVLRRKRCCVRRRGFRGVRAPGSRVGSRRYRSRCSRAMIPAPLACVVSACAVRWGGQRLPAATAS